jgi:hypothetical protein
VDTVDEHSTIWPLSARRIPPCATWQVRAAADAAAAPPELAATAVCTCGHTSPRPRRSAAAGAAGAGAEVGSEKAERRAVSSAAAGEAADAAASTGVTFLSGLLVLRDSESAPCVGVGVQLPASLRSLAPSSETEQLLMRCSVPGATPRSFGDDDAAAVGGLTTSAPARRRDLMQRSPTGRALAAVTRRAAGERTD